MGRANSGSSYVSGLAFFGLLFLKEMQRGGGGRARQGVGIRTNLPAYLQRWHWMLPIHIPSGSCTSHKFCNLSPSRVASEDLKFT